MSLSKREVFFINLGQWVVLCLIFFFAVVIWRTWGWVSPPFKVIQTEYSAIKTMDGTIVVSFDCEADIYSDVEVHTHREVRHTKTGMVFGLPANNTMLPQGKRQIKRTFYIPSPAPSGEYCVEQYTDWRPAFSLMDRRTPTQTKCFEVR